MNGSDPRFSEPLRTLDAVLADHITDEETKHFLQLRAAPARRARGTGGEGGDGEESGADASPPSTPNSQLFHKLVGPGGGMVDRLRDRLAGRSTG